jgi:Domain of unknown function (DU1801)
MANKMADKMASKTGRKSAELKTAPTDASVAEFLAAIPDERRRADARHVCDLLTKVSGVEPRMWGDAIVGFGERHLSYASGRELDWFEIGFSPRRQNTTLYLTDGVEPHQDLLDRLGKHTTGVGCVYLKRLSDVDNDVLTELVTRSIGNVREK